MNALTNREQEAFNLWRGTGLSLLDIAVVMGISVNTVRLHLQHAQEKGWSCGKRDRHHERAINDLLYPVPSQAFLLDAARRLTVIFGRKVNVGGVA